MHIFFTHNSDVAFFAFEYCTEEVALTADKDGDEMNTY